MAGATGPGGHTDNSNKTSTVDRSQANTKSIDNSAIYADGGSSLSLQDLNLSGDNSVYNITDNGAVAAASQNTALLIKTSGDLGAQLMDAVNAQQQWASHLVDQTTAQSQAAIQTVAAVVSKPLDMQDPKNIMVALGIVVIGVVAFMALKGAR